MDLYEHPAIPFVILQADHDFVHQLEAVGTRANCADPPQQLLVWHRTSSWVQPWTGGLAATAWTGWCLWLQRFQVPIVEFSYWFSTLEIFEKMNKTRVYEILGWVDTSIQLLDAFSISSFNPWPTRQLADMMRIDEICIYIYRYVIHKCGCSLQPPRV